MKIVVDIYKADKKDIEENFLIYENRIIFYNSKTRELMNCGLRDENIGKYKIGQIIED